MPTPSEPDSAPSPELLLADFLARRSAGSTLEFEALCRAHPEQAATLRALLEQSEQAQIVLKCALRAAEASAAPATPGGAEAAPSFAARLKQKYGAGVDPEVSLEEAPGEPSESGTSELVKRLKEHSLEQSRYSLQGEIARGGMGAILRVWDEDLRRHLAMKVILGKAESTGDAATPAVDARTLGRFLEEAQVTGQLDHPGIVPVHELGLDSDGRVYFTMKLVKGRDLKHVFDLVFEGQEGWNETRALSVILKACEALAYAHKKGVIHRDLKPANVMVGNFGEVYVMDWGLARVLGRKDTHDIRIAPEFASELSSIKTERREEREELTDSPIVTMDGDVMGTPAYMALEQARGEIEKLGPRSDVYSMGALLYHLLARRPPYVPVGARVSNRMVLQWVLEGAPKPLHELRPDVPAELVAIVEKAMAREAVQRYADTLELAEDLRAFLEHRVVGAYEAGAWAEARKWVQRNKPLAASIAAALVVIAGGTVTFLTVLQSKNTDLALATTSAQANERSAKEQEARARREKANVLKLSAFQTLDDLTKEAGELWPAEPGLVERYRAWMRKAEQLVAKLPEFRSSLSEIEQRALPQSAEERARERSSHPRAKELEDKVAELGWMRRMLGEEPWPSEAELGLSLSKEVLPADANGLNALAWPLVDPEAPVYGSEVKAMLLARRAVAAAGAAERPGIRDSLAWAYFRLGRFDEALAEEKQALQEVDSSKYEEFHGYVKKLESALNRWRDAKGDTADQVDKVHGACLKYREKLVQEVAGLEAELSKRGTWRFAEDAGGAETGDRWWHDQVSKLVAALESFEDPRTGLMRGVSEAHGWGVEKRLEFASRVEECTVGGAEAQKLWSEAIAAIASSPKYGGMKQTPQLGLLPIGADPESGLWEFAHLQSGEPAVRGADGKLVLSEDMGLVFVLIPGGTCWMGAQRTDPNGRNYDRAAPAGTSPVHEVTLSPYFLSKYEMTQGQWERLTGRNPSGYRKENYRLTWNKAGKSGSTLHPVEQVTWTNCMEVLGRLGCELPTEAQWENGCRGGTSSVYWSGDGPATLVDVGNVADQYAKDHGGGAWGSHEPWDDGNTIHAEIGSYRANAYGLHDVHGNVWEWCRDGFADYSAGKQVDPMTPWKGASNRVSRGGSFGDPASIARSEFREDDTPEFQDLDLGLRPARAAQLSAAQPLPQQR